MAQRDDTRWLIIPGCCKVIGRTTIPRFPRAAGLFGGLAEISRRCPAFGLCCAFPPRQTRRDQNSEWRFQALLISDWIDQRPLSLSRTGQIRPVGFLDAPIERKLHSDAFAIWREGCFRFTEIQRYLSIDPLPLLLFLVREDSVPIFPICLRHRFLALAPTIT